MALSFETRKVMPAPNTALSQHLSMQSFVKENKVMIAQKGCYKGALFGHISNGGGSIDLGNGYSVQFIANAEYVTLQLFHHAIGQKPMNQTWQKSKTIQAPKKEQPKPQAPVKVQEQIKKEELI